MSIGFSLFIVGSAAAAGWGAGWWFHHSAAAPADRFPDKAQDDLARLSDQLSRSQEQLQQAQAEVTRLQHEAERVQSKASQERLVLDVARRDAARTKDFIAQLQHLAQHLAEDVGEHNTRVQAINLELGAGSTEAQVVLTAVAKLLDANAHLQDQLETAEGKLQRQSLQLKTHMAEARTDALTGLANRRAFDEQLRQLERDYHLHGQPFCVMVIDVDNFKAFNDSHGHHAGDEVLRHVARVLEEKLGSSALVCRYGGEEFAALFPLADLNATKLMAEQARLALGAVRVPWKGKLLQITACAGLAQLSGEETAEQAVARADAALYAGKTLGRDLGHWHDGHSCHRLEIHTAGSQALPTHRDPLTGLATRAALQDDLQRRLAKQVRGSTEPLAGLLIELDGFPALTARYGESAGETMLRATAQFLRAALREMDHVARFDRQQFALLLPGASRLEAEGIAERLRVAIEKCKLPAQNGLLTFTISSGLAMAAPGDTLETFCQRLQRATAAAQAAGGNCLRACDAQPLAATH